ncbi:CPBP family intramembrane glutamic endopeptidase [Sellimonas sp.]|uniref:CPBP family intramembrane glutamic endopeptidase n=1 Tax=Sellimonas sp. TaxID=2021466 RepID=UPI00257F4FA2|nr:type II CAAX endopeptidase family protein [Sellimonas sp.]
MKKSYIVFGVFTAFTQAVFAVLLFLEKFGVLHFDGQIAGIAMAVVPAVGVALTKSCDEKYEEIQKLFYVLFGCYCLVLVLDILGILSSGTANVIAGTAMTIGSLTLLWLYNYGKKKSNTFDGFREIRKEIILFTLILLGRNIFAVFAYSDEYIAIFSNLLALVQAAGLMFVGAAQYWGEEYAWRGFLQKPLQGKFGKRWGIVLLGIIWETYHFPMWFTVYDLDIWEVVMRYLLAVALTFVLGYFYMKTDNIWTPICGHALYNGMSAGVLPMEAAVNMGKTGAIIYTLLTVVCFSLFALKKEYCSKNFRNTIM